MVHSFVVERGNSTEGQVLWMDNMYFRFMGKLPRQAAVRTSRSLWMTNSTFQASLLQGSDDSGLLQRPETVLSTARVYAEGELQLC
jgi:hypothetical protein